MKSIFVFLLMIFFLTDLNPAMAGLFGNSSSSSSGGAPFNTDEIPIRDEAYKMMEKRKKEAQELIVEGLDLIKAGQRKKNESLITKGRIKKEIGEKQLQVLKDQAEIKKEDDKSYGW